MSNPYSEIKFTRRPSLSFAFLLISLAVVSSFPSPATSQARRNGKIAFTSDRDGSREIYLMNSDGTDQVRITNNSIFDDHASFSPDGTRIAFISQRASGEFAIFQMNADGTGKTEITPVNFQPRPISNYGNGWTISWSPNGSQLVFTDALGNNLMIAVVNADGSGRRTLTDGSGPSWSPDGSKILFIRGTLSSGLVTIRPDGTDLRVLPDFPGFYDPFDASWSPTGAQIATTAFDFANAEIFILNADGTNPQDFHGKCLESPQGCSRVGAPSWSPDGRTLVFLAAGFQSGLEIFVKDIADGPSRRLTNTTGNNTNPSWQALPGAPAIADFDGDGRSDISVFRPTDGFWYIDRSGAGFSATSLGSATDLVTPADYDGDRKTDISVFRDGTWFWLNSSNGVMQQAAWGIAGDRPQRADYTGDGRAELAVYRSGTWFIYDIATGVARSEQFGVASDQPVAADYDGDGRTDVAVYRDGVWYLNRSSDGFAAVQFGLPTDRPVVGDYDGDAKSDVAVYRDGTWYLLRSSQGFAALQFGIARDIPVPADYDGDGRTDIAVYRDGGWYIVQSSNGAARYEQFGLSTDIPVTAISQ